MATPSNSAIPRPSERVTTRTPSAREAMRAFVAPPAASPTVEAARYHRCRQRVPCRWKAPAHQPRVSLACTHQRKGAILGCRTTLVDGFDQGKAAPPFTPIAYGAGIGFDCADEVFQYRLMGPMIADHRRRRTR